MSYQSKSIASVPALVPPRVKIVSEDLQKFPSANPAETVVSPDSVVITLQDMPEEYLDGTMPLFVELLRLPQRRGKGRGATGRYVNDKAWTRPTDTIRAGHVDGTRFGKHANVKDATGYFGPPTYREVSWDMTGLGRHGKITLPVARIFGPWYRAAKVADHLGASVNAMCYINGRNGVGTSSMGQKGISAGTTSSRWRFAFATKDPNGHYVVGPESETVLVRTAEPLSIREPYALNATQSVYLVRHRINPNADKNNSGRVLAATMAKYEKVR